jgi:hypothetical protein
MIIELMGRMVSTRWAHPWTNLSSGTQNNGTMAMPVDRTLPKACMCHISLVVMAGRHVAGAEDGRHHRLHPYHTIYPPSHPRCFRYLPRPRRDRLVLPPCSVARTRTGALRGASSITTAAQGQISHKPAGSQNFIMKSTAAGVRRVHHHLGLCLVPRKIHYVKRRFYV